VACTAGTAPSTDRVKPTLAEEQGSAAGQHNLGGVDGTEACDCNAAALALQPKLVPAQDTRCRPVRSSLQWHGRKQHRRRSHLLTVDGWGCGPPVWALPNTRLSPTARCSSLPVYRCKRADM
jgi:hypothetical protein